MQVNQWEHKTSGNTLGLSQCSSPADCAMKRCTMTKSIWSYSAKWREFVKKLDVLDIFPHTSGRNQSSPNENIPGIWSQPQKRWQRRLAQQAIFTVNHIEARIPVNYRTLISDLKKYSRKWLYSQKNGRGIRKAFSHRLFFLWSCFAFKCFLKKGRREKNNRRV